MALCFISHMNRVSMSVAGNSRIMAQYGFSPTEMGTVYSAFLLVYTIFMIPGGFFIDRFGPRLALLVMGGGSALFGALTGAVGLGWTIAGRALLTLILIRGLMGLLTTPLHPASAHAVNLWTAVPQRSLANGLVTGAALLGIACTYPIFGALIRHFDWPGAFLATGVVTILLALIWTVTAKDEALRRAAAEALPETRAGTLGSSSWLDLLADRNLILLTVSYAAVGYFQYLFFYWMQYYFDQVLHIGKTRSEFFAGLPPLAMALGMPLGGWISDRLQRRCGFRWGRALVPVVGLLLSAVCLGIGIFVKTPNAIVAWFSLALGVMGASEGSFWSTAVELGRQRDGTAAAIMNTGGNGGGMLAPVVTPWVSGLFGWPVGIAIGSAVCLAGAVCWLGINPSRNDPAKDI